MAARADVDRLISDLTNADPDVRASAPVKLGYSHDDRAVDPLIAALDDEYRKVRFLAALALSMLNAKPALPRLLRALAEDAEGDVRMQCVHAISSIAPGECFDALAEALADPHPHVRMAVCSSFQASKEHRAIPLLRTMLDDPDWNVRLGVCEALVALEAVDERVLEAIGQLCGSPEAGPYEEGLASAAEMFRSLMETPECVGFVSQCLGNEMSEATETGLRETLELANEEIGESAMPQIPDHPLADLAERAKRVLDSASPHYS
jgi:HEAT repeat protein